MGQALLGIQACSPPGLFCRPAHHLGQGAPRLRFRPAQHLAHCLSAFSGHRGEGGGAERVIWTSHAADKEAHLPLEP